MTGLELKLRRVAADVTGRELADAMGVTASRVTYIEGRRLVTPEAEARYLGALATCTTKSKNAAQTEEVA